MAAVKCYLQNDRRSAPVIRELGYSNRHIQFFETSSGELIDSIASIGIVEEDVLVPTFAVDIEAEKLRKFFK